MEKGLPLVLDIQEDVIIKVLGVGGGGCNAVNYMYTQGIQDVSFMVCNTDTQALAKMSVPAKLPIAQRGAGGVPEKARNFAEENRDRIREALDDGTRMLFVAAGMGGGTGTGASPVVAEIARELNILTVGIVTIPFAFEGKKTIRKAVKGIAELARHTDALLVINNEKLKQLFSDFDLPNAFSKADEVVCNAARSIAEIITVPGYVNTDFQDVYNTLKDGNMAIMNVGIAGGEKRITHAIENALNSPLVNTTNVHGAGRILLNFYCSHEHAVRMEELNEVQAFSNSIGEEVDIKWGVSYDDTLGDSVRVTIIATGYSVSDIPELEAVMEEQGIAENRTAQVVAPVKTIDDAIETYYGTGTNVAAGEQQQELPPVEISEEKAAPTLVWEGDDCIDVDTLSSEEQQQMEDIPAYMRRR